MMNVNSSPDAKRPRIDAGAGAGPSGDVWKEGRVQTRLQQQEYHRNLHHYKQHQQQTEGDNIETDPPAAEGTATQASRHLLTARFHCAIVLGENDSDLFGDFEDEELHHLLGPTPEPNQRLHPAVEQLH